MNDEMASNCVRLFYKISSENQNLIICLKVYISELNNNFITQPNLIVLLYDKISENSFEKLVTYYESLIENKKYENTKFILVGNKKDLINEEEDDNKTNDENEEKKDITNNEEKKKNDKNEGKEKDIINNEENKENKENEEKNENEEKKNYTEINENNKDNENNDINKDDEKETLSSNKEKLSNFDIKVNDYYKEKKFFFKNEISGITGEGVIQLFENIIILLFNDIKNLEEDVKEFDISFSFYKNLEQELNISSAGQSYHSNEYKKEIKKINKRRRFSLCCFRCSIF